MYPAVRSQSVRVETSPVESLRARRSVTHSSKSILSATRVPGQGELPTVGEWANRRRHLSANADVHAIAPIFRSVANQGSVIPAGRSNLELNPQCKHPDK